jgi:tetratricopeptide (TPR) repeat protein
MKRMLNVFALSFLLTSAQSTSQASAESRHHVHTQATATMVYSQNPGANNLFLRAREYLTKGDPRIGGPLADTREAIRLFEQALEKDPKFALAYVEISRAWMQLAYSVPGGVTNTEALPHAKAAALKAVALDENLPAAHLALASVHFDFEHDWRKAEREHELVLRLSPNDAAAHSTYATYLGAMGRFGKALAEAERAEELKPSATTEYTLARIHYWMRRYDEAAEYCRRSLKKEETGVAHFLLGFVYVAKNKADEAIPELKKAVRMLSNNGGALAALAYAYAMDGKKDEALRMVDELRTRPNRAEAEIVPYRVAAVYVALGDKDRAIEWLRKDYARSGRWMSNLKVDPVMDPLRSDLRFQELMRKMNFKE